MHIRGEDGLDEEDLAVARRLIQLKADRDVPYAFDACFNSWLAVEEGDQRGIMAVLGLANAAPATYPLGETLICHMSHGGPDRREDFAHVFISPQLNGRNSTTGRLKLCIFFRDPRDTIDEQSGDHASGIFEHLLDPAVDSLVRARHYSRASFSGAPED